jgi:phospholipid N-methyltransferase
MDKIGTATYSPEDNKLRLYPFSRLDKETYDLVRSKGFIWAPRQGLFVAPMWTPGRADFLSSLCGEIEDEDKSLVERAEERADRFGNYSESRNKDAERATEAVKAISDNIPLGQPILIGHHSEKRARRDAQKIENGMRHAVKMWETSEYWKQRAAGAIHHAKYKERPDVRARRIKKLEADKRSRERTRAESEKWLKLWNEENLSIEKARQIANYCSLSVIRREEINSYWSAWDVLEPDDKRYKDCPSWTVEQVKESANKAYPKNIEYCNRWISHIENRILYEKAMMEYAGGMAADKNKPEKGGACKCWVSGKKWTEIVKVNRVTVTVMDNWGNGGPDFPRTVPFNKLRAVMSKAEYESFKRGEYSPEEPTKKTAQEPKEENKDIEAMKESLSKGIKIVTSAQLFPTPPEIAEKMVELAEIGEDETILEPSAGTGNILKAIGERGGITAIEINQELCGLLKSNFPNVDTIQRDFLSFSTRIIYDKIIMNPPFEKGSDIKHIKHALSMLAPGGRLVALCANGPRQQKEFKDTADYWEDLPDGSFSSQGTGVNVAVVVLKSEERAEYTGQEVKIELGEQINLF